MRLIQFPFKTLSLPVIYCTPVTSMSAESKERKKETKEKEEKSRCSCRRTSSTCLRIL